MAKHPPSALILLLVAAAGVALMRPAASQERREGVVSGAFTFGHVHGVMQGLERALKELLGAFLAGDVQGISEQADVVVAGMSEVAEAFPEEPAGDRQLWSATWEISKRARMMQSAIHAGRHQDAYRQYARLANRCIQCHEARRVWGRFSDASSAGAAPAAGSREAAP